MENPMPIPPRLTPSGSPVHPEVDPASRLRTVSRWIAVTSALVALLTQVVQLLALAWRELPRP